MRNMKNKVIGVFAIMLVVFVSVAYLDILPTIGDAQSPANTHVSEVYIEGSLENINIPNLVTAILADYRGFDTLFETTILYLAGLAVIVVLSEHKKVVHKKRNGEEVIFGGTVILSSFRVLIPLILLYAMYVLFHGEISLGGGFQAGALIAIAYTIERIIGSKQAIHVTETTAVCVSGVGVFIYAFTGILAMLGGGNFLEYGKLPFGFSYEELHSVGIIMIEAGITICFMATIIDILEAVLERAEFDD